MSDSTDHDILLSTAVRLATQGGQMAAARIGQARTSRKADRTFVTQVDTEIQDRLLNLIADEFPSHAVLAEEEQTHAGHHAPIEKADYCWVVDPLDGTRNFSRAIPVFATSVAVMRNGRPLVGAVCNAMTGQVFAAALGGGATLDGQAIHVRGESGHRDTIIAVRGRSGRAAPSAVHRWTDHYVLRNIGAAALHLAFVAAGMFDAAFSVQCKLWDVAAAALLITEAGGVITTAKGDPIFPCHPARYRGQDLGFLAAGPMLHRELLPDAREE